MIARVQSHSVDQLEAIARDLAHPFHEVAQNRFDSLKVAWETFNVGAIVTNGETGAASAAMDSGALRYIPLTGFAQRGKINETGRVRDHHAPLLLEPDDRFSTLHPDEVKQQTERCAPYARRLLLREADELNAQYSCAVVIMSPGDLVASNAVDIDRLRIFRERTNTHVCDFTGNPAQQGEELAHFLSIRKPLFLNVVGPRESLSETCLYSPYDQVKEILLKALRA